MNDLLAFAVDAHGGLDRWNAFSELRVDLDIDGAIWHFKQQPDLLHGKVFELSTQRQRLTISPFGGDRNHSVFDAGQLSIQSDQEELIELRADPVASFESQTYESPWDRMHVAYFASEALWTYLTSPFLYTYPGFETEELEPWFENGEEWRRLQVTFPDYILSHCKTQITHFGPDGLMRRHDYTVDILKGATGANYPTDYQDVQGLKLPAKRRIYAYDDAGLKVEEPLLVSLDFTDFRFA
ncbi:hypothetical protein [Sphingomonas faeni]|uniref:hypothetical protein n=1 Tax=Sphingomonas faeni TaxID=185950 RepID=UPI00334CEB3E